MSLIIVDMPSLSDRRSSGFCSDSERRESLGSGRHGLVTKMVFWICFLFFFVGPWSLEGTGWSQTCYFAIFFVLVFLCFFGHLRFGRHGLVKMMVLILMRRRIMVMMWTVPLNFVVSVWN